MKMFVCLTMVVALCICGTAAAQQDTRVLAYDGQVLELRPPARTPTLGEVLDAHGVVLDQADSVELFLAGILRAASLGADEVHALQVSWIGADPEAGAKCDPLSVDVVATIGSDTALVNMYVSDGSLHVLVTRYDQNGEPTSVKLECVILEPIAVLETVGDAKPVQTYYLAAGPSNKCVCDKNNVDKYGCTSDDCYAANTCPSLPAGSSGGFACGWITEPLQITVARPVEMRSGSGVGVRP